MKKLFSTIVISALLCVNTFATPVVVNSEPATFEKPVIIRQSTSFLSLREIASNLLDNVNLQWNAENKTAILVTHDKEEALIMSDKIAVMVNGKIEQFDKPETLYQKPRTKSVANIFGERNYIKGKIENEVFKSNILYIDAKGYNNLDIVEAMIPKECIKLYSSNYNDGINGYIQRKQYAGDKTFYDININGEVLKCTSISNEYNQGDCVKICVDRDNIVFFPL